MPTPPTRGTVLVICFVAILLFAQDALAAMSTDVTGATTTVTAVTMPDAVSSAAMTTPINVQVQIEVTAPVLVATPQFAPAAVEQESVVVEVQYKYRHLVLATGGGFSTGLWVRPRVSRVTAGMFGLEIQALAAYRISRNNGFGFGAQGLLRTGAGWHTDGVIFEGALLPAMYWRNHILALGPVTKMQAGVATGTQRWGAPSGPETGGIVSLTHLLPFGTKRIASMYLRFAGGGYGDASAFASASFGMSFGVH